MDKEEAKVKGLELSERYFSEVGASMIEEKFPSYRQRIAAGLVGDGSECFGFDDEISRDHDWGPSFCLWLTKQDYETVGISLQSELNNLPRDLAGIKAREESTWGGGRTGVFEIGQFYQRFMGIDHVPAHLLEWRAIPESNLAVATNGRVFTDPIGEFTAFRNKLKEFYPEDIRLKKIASRCMTMAQSGQYNYMRCVRRGEYVAAQWAESQFIGDTISMVFLLNRKYKPFYKWMHKAMKRLPIGGDAIYKLLFDLVTTHEVESGEKIYKKKSQLIEEACQYVIEELRRQKLSDSGSDFLLDHGPIVQGKIQDPQIRGINVWVE
jgi:hypothetical protein